MRPRERAVVKMGLRRDMFGVLFGGWEDGRGGVVWGGCLKGWKGGGLVD